MEMQQFLQKLSH